MNMNMNLTVSSVFVLLCLVVVGFSIPASPLVGINTGCSPQSIHSFCKPENLFCIKSACSQCILRNRSNPFTSFCQQLSACVCSISNDEDCYGKIDETCL